MKTPPKEKTVPRITNFRKNAVHQADLLFLPDDKGYKYALVVVDTATKQVDARALKAKSSGAVISNLLSIWNGKYLRRPQVLATDPGTEFKKQVSTFLQKKKIRHKVGRINRHRQQALAERFNYLFGRAVGTKQNKKEMETGETSKEWKKDLPKVVRIINEHRKEKEKSPSQKRKELPTLRCRGRSCKLLEKGTKVRVIADQPRDIVTGRRLHGQFRASDMRWNPVVRRIEKISLKPGQPPMYKVTHIDNAMYTREQLQVVGKETKVDQSNRKWIVERIVRKKKKNGKLFYVVKWKGWQDTTDEPASALKKDIPRMVADFEKKEKE